MLPQFLAPILSIFKNLYVAVNTLGKDNTKYDNLPDIFAKTDSYNPFLFEKLRKTIICELPVNSDSEKEVLHVFDSMMDEIDMLCKDNKIRKHSIHSQDSNAGEGATGEEENKETVNEDLLCNICYFNEKNATFIPCNHQSCQKCI